VVQATESAEAPASEQAPAPAPEPVQDGQSAIVKRKHKTKRKRSHGKIECLKHIDDEGLDIDKDSADSDDEELLIRTGNIPDNWYDDYADGDGLVGYDVKGEQVQKSADLKRDELDEFLRRQNDPNWWRELKDKLNNKNVKLSREDVEMIERIRDGRLPFAEDDEDTHLIMPLENDSNPAFMHALTEYNPKRRFVRSLSERKLVNRYLQAIRRGWLKVRTRQEIIAEYKKRYNNVWDIWKDESITAYRPRRLPKRIDAPKKDPPSHSESYNPPKEYLLTQDEQDEENIVEPEERMYNYNPQ
jgi:ribosome biogenesis protein ERB1